MKLFFYVSLFCFNRLMSPLSKDETRHDSSLAFVMSLSRDQTVFMHFCVLVLLAVKMVADVTDTRYVIPSLEFKIWTKSILNFHMFTKHVIG